MKNKKMSSREHFAVPSSSLKKKKNNSKTQAVLQSKEKFDRWARRASEISREKHKK
jgi:hypothetical protein